MVFITMGLSLPVCKKMVFCYHRVLSTVGQGSISTFLMGNRFHKITHPQSWKQYVVQIDNNFPRDGQCTAVIGTNRIVKLTMTRWLCCDTIQSAMAL